MKNKRVFLWILNLGTLAGIVSCKKTNSPEPQPGGDTTVFEKPVDPPVAASVGFYLDDWAPITFTPPSYVDTAVSFTTASSFVTIDAADIIAKVPNSVFGQNANIWMTQMVTETSLINHLKNLKPNIIRFPGGSLSDLYFWNAEVNNPPSDAPDSLLDASGNKIPAGYWYGKNNQSWTCSVANYYNMLQQTGNQGIITINYGYARYGMSNDPVAAAAHLAADWVRYDNGRTKYWEIGNECNGTWEAGYRIKINDNKDGQPEYVTGDLYGKHVKVYIDSMKKASQETGKTIYIGAYLLERQPESWQTATDKSWNSGVISQVKNAADFYIVHSYYTPYQQNSPADLILNTATDVTTSIMGFIKTSLTAGGAELKPVALTEWNITSQGSMQQVSFVNGMHAAILVGEAIKNKYGQTSRWDLANGWAGGNDHGLFNIGDEPGGVPKWNPRPAFYYMYYFRKMLGDRMINSTVTGPVDLKVYASSFTSGEKGAVLVNKGTLQQNVQITLKNANPGNRYYWYLLRGGTDNGEFSRKVFVNGKGPSGISGGPANEYATLKPYSAQTQNKIIKITVPPRSVAYLVIDK